MESVQHLVTGNNDTNFEMLANMYNAEFPDVNLTANEIAIATTGGHADANGIYNWMESNGVGVRQTWWAAGNRWHLSLKPGTPDNHGAIALIPRVLYSLSPLWGPDDTATNTETVITPDGTLPPEGNQTGMSSGNVSSGETTTTVTEDGVVSVTPNIKKAGADSLTWILIAGVLGFVLFGQKGSKTKRAIRKARRTIRRRTSRRR
jgi:hypothetical protein